MQDLKSQIIEAIKKVEDPEIHIDVWTLGLIYRVEVKNNEVSIQMTFTTPACPYGPMLAEAVKTAVNNVEGIESTSIDITFDPPWEPPEEVKIMMGLV